MPASTFMPDVVVEIAFDSGYLTPAASRTWTDVSAYVEAQDAITIARGRSDELSDVSPSRLTLTLDNTDGRFTPENASGAYYPNVKKGRPIRVSATWPLAAGTTYRRFTGYVDEWPVEWPDKTSGKATSTVTASSRLARLGRAAAFDNIIATEVMADAPIGYWPLGDAQDSTRAANIAESDLLRSLTIEQAGSGGTLTFGAGTGPGTDGLSAVVTDRVSIDDGKYLRVQFEDEVCDDASGHFSIEAWFSTTVDGSIASIGSGDNFAALTVGTSKLAFFRGTSAVAFSAADVDDGETHHAVAKVSPNGIVFQVELMLDGVVVDTDTTALPTGDLDDMGAVARSFLVGRQHPGSNGPVVFEGTLAQVALYNTDVSTARFAEHYTAGATGFEGESSDARVDRLAEYVGIPIAEVATEAGNTTTMSAALLGGQAPVSALLDVAHTENGLLFDAGDGTLTFHARGHRYNFTSALTLSTATGQIEGDLQPKLDDQGQANDVTVAIPDGSSTHVVSQASVDDYGYYKDDVLLLSTSESEAEDRANYMVSMYADPQVRVPNASVQVVTQASATITSLLARELGDGITLAGLPSQAPSSSMSFFVEGYTEAITVSESAGESWLMTLNLSPGSIPGTFWTLGTGALDSTTILGY